MTLPDIGNTFDAVIIQPLEKFPAIGEIVKGKMLDQAGRFQLRNSVVQREPRFMISAEFEAALWDHIRVVPAQSLLRPPLDTSVWEQHRRTKAGTHWYYRRPYA